MKTDNTIEMLEAKRDELWEKLKRKRIKERKEANFDEPIRSYRHEIKEVDTFMMRHFEN